MFVIGAMGVPAMKNLLRLGDERFISVSAFEGFKWPLTHFARTQPL